MPITPEIDSVSELRAAMKEIHRRRWQRKRSIFYRAGVILSLFGLATLSVVALLMLLHTF